jgi:long-subunit fatty acid transport protein
MNRIKQNLLIAVPVFFWFGFFISIGLSQTNTGSDVIMEIPSSPNPVGSGARALGMGGAFIAVADDATASSWNPGGLIQLEKPEMSFVLGYIQRSENNRFGENPEASGKQMIDDFNLNYLSVTYPFQINNRNMIFSLNYQQLYDFNRYWNFNFNYPSGHKEYFNYKQKGAIYAIGIAYSVQIINSFSIGVAMNYWGNILFDNKWEQRYNIQTELKIGGKDATDFYNKKEEYSFEGWNANLGFLWKLNERWTLGGVFKTPFTADIDHKITIDETTILPTGKIKHFAPLPVDYDEKLHMPMSYGIGLAYRFSDNLSISGDIYRTHWNDFELELEDGRKTSPISSRNTEDSDIDPTICLRMGIEYLIIGKKIVLPFRGGVFYDAAPAENSPDDYYGFSLGSGFVFKRFIFDIAYQFRFGNDVGGSVLEELDFSQDVREHIVYASLIIHF